MQLVAMSISGFRSLQDVGPIPIRRPTILTGPNDSGKSAVIDALAYLLGAQNLTTDDRTFLPVGTHVEGDTDPSLAESEVRVGETWVEGEFSLSPKEQKELNLPGLTRIRRFYAPSTGSRLEYLTDAPVNEDLRNLEGRSLAALREISEGLQVKPDSTLDGRAKSSWISALNKYAATQPKTDAWVVAPSGIAAAMPKFLRFGDAQSAESAIRTALDGRYKAHLEDEALKQQVQVLETELSRRVREDAQGLVDHIRERCPDLVRVDVRPVVSFTSGLRSTDLILARTDGEPISLNSVGAGRYRRISLAIWEWTSELLRKDVEEQAASDDPHSIVLAYDEPDTHLDYLQQRRVMKLIREQCLIPGVSMLVATHSMNLIDGAAIEDIVHLDLESDRTQISRLLSDLDDEANGQYLSDIAAALGLRNTVLLHERCFVGVEGATEEQTFPLLFRLVTGRPIHAAGVVIVGCHNNEGALKFIGYLAKSKRQIMVIIDGDSRASNKMFSEANIAKEGLDFDSHICFLGAQNQEFESLFANDQWCRVANAAWPRDDSRPWDDSDVEKLRAGKFSTQLLQTFKEGSSKGPTSKPAMMHEMVRRLEGPEEVPEPLRDAFLKLEKLAALDL